MRVPFTTAAVVIAQTFVAMPFLVVSLEGALRASGDRYERVAATLGSGAVLSFARALGEFGATITFAGSLEGITRTLPVDVYHEAQSDVDSAVALSLLLVLVAVVVIAVAAATGEEYDGGEDGITEVEDANGEKVKSVLLEPIPVTEENIEDTVISDGFYTIEEICTDDYADTDFCKEALGG